MTRDEMRLFKEVTDLGIEHVRLKERCESLERERDMWKQIAERLLPHADRAAIVSAVAAQGGGDG